MRVGTIVIALSFWTTMGVGCGPKTPAPRTARRATATPRRRVVDPIARAEQAAKAARRRGDFPRCGLIFAALAQGNPGGGRAVARAPGFRWKAAQCFLRAGRASTAVTLLGKILEAKKRGFVSAPQAGYLPLARFYLARSYDQLTRYGEAAEHYEQMALRNSGHARTHQALIDALRLRLGRGERERVREDALSMIQRHGRAKPALATAAFRRYLDSTLAGPGLTLDKQQERVERFLARYGSAGDPGDVLAIREQLGQRAWKKSCRLPLLGGLCARRIARWAGGKMTRVIRAQKRDAKLLQLTRKQYRLAWKRWRRGKALGQLSTLRAPGVRQAARQALVDRAARARFMGAESRFEEHIAWKPPGLQATPPRFARDAGHMAGLWLPQRLQQTQWLVGAYRDVGSLREGKRIHRSPEWSLAGLVRIGQLKQRLAEQLIGLPKPARWSANDWKTWRSLLVPLVAKLTQKALASYRQCLKVAAQWQWPSPWAEQCRRSIGKLQPLSYPPRHERFRVATAPDIDRDGARRTPQSLKALMERLDDNPDDLEAHALATRRLLAKTHRPYLPKPGVLSFWKRHGKKPRTGGQAATFHLQRLISKLTDAAITPTSATSLLEAYYLTALLYWWQESHAKKQLAKQPWRRRAGRTGGRKKRDKRSAWTLGARSLDHALGLVGGWRRQGWGAGACGQPQKPSAFDQAVARLFRLRAQVAWQRRQWSAVRRALGEALKCDGKNNDARLMLGRLALSAGSCDAAAKILGAALVADQTNTLALVGLGAATRCQATQTLAAGGRRSKAKALGQLTRAKGYYNAALKVDPKLGDALINLAHLLATYWPQGPPGARKKRLLTARGLLQRYLRIPWKRTGAAGRKVARALFVKVNAAYRRGGR